MTFKPFITPLSEKESYDLYSALNAGLWACEKHGYTQEAERLKKQIDMLNHHDRIGGWDNEEERLAWSQSKMLEEFRVYGTE